MVFVHRRPRPRPRTRRLGAAAAAATVGLGSLELFRVWSRGRAPVPRSPSDVLHGGEIAVRETLDVLRAGSRSGSANETAVLNLFLSFGATFGAARAVTHAIRLGVGPLGNVQVGRRHIHHFVPGIGLVLLAGGASIAVRHEPSDQWLALPFGAGAALILDETALLIELSDVYWSESGVLSIDVGLGATAGLACLAMLVRLVRRGEAVVLVPHDAAGAS